MGVVADTVQFRANLSGSELTEAMGRIERLVHGAHPKITRMFVEAAPLASHRVPSISTRGAASF